VSPSSKDIPVIVFSVSSFETNKQYALELGASEYVQKPVELQAFTDIVCQIVVNWLGRKAETDAVR
jgi:CheY-like chemotaxis protein